MSSNKRLKIFQRAIARYGLYTFAWLFKWLPYRLVHICAAMLIAIGFRCTLRQRAIAQESLDIAFGDQKSQEEKQTIIKDCFVSFGKGMNELLYCLAHPKAIEQMVIFEGKEHLDAAMAKGQGVIAVTAHFGNFPLMMLFCALKGYDTSAIIRPTRDEKLSDYLEKKRTAIGLKTIYAVPRKKCVVQSMRKLRDGGLLFIPIDQNFGNGSGVYVDFFGRKAATATGPAVFAQRTGAVILPMFIIRQDNDVHKIIIEAPISLEERKNEKETITATMIKITEKIEQYVRKYPQEWAWMHRRWKSQPSE